MPLKEFLILEKIGEGAYSTVYKVQRIQDGKIYALKQVKINNLKEKQKQNALNQVRLLASISCEYIIKYKESFFDEKSSTLCIVMEYAQNGDLQKLILKNKERSQFLSETQIWKLAKHILLALSVLHQKQIIHRDLKSANIFMTPNAYKIADLNVSKLLKHSLAYTQTGTPYYASPQVWQDKPYELKSDIWSLGCILYETAALRPPFTATSMDGLYKKIMKGVYPRLPDHYSQKLQQFISKCLQISPLRRPTSRQLLTMIPQTIDVNLNIENHSQMQPQINLLQTIKVPRNLNSWRNDLPKADYSKNQISQNKNSSQFMEISVPLIQNNKKYGRISQNKLRQIVKQKQNEKASLDKKLSLKKIHPQGHEIYDSVRSKIYTEHYEAPSSHYHQSSIPNLIVQQKPFVPRVNKIYSQAVNDLQYSRRLNENHQRVEEILNRMKEAERKKHAYNRPSWWG